MFQKCGHFASMPWIVEGFKYVMKLKRLDCSGEDAEGLAH